MLQCYNVTMLQCYNVTMLKCYNVTMLQCYNVAPSQNIYYSSVLGLQVNIKKAVNERKIIFWMTLKQSQQMAI